MDIQIDSWCERSTVDSVQSVYKEGTSLKNYNIVAMPPAPGRAAPGAKRSWVRQQFYDYPVSDGTQWYGAASSGKTKVYCVKCFDAGFNELKTREHSEVSQNI